MLHLSPPAGRFLGLRCVISIDIVFEQGLLAGHVLHLGSSLLDQLGLAVVASISP